jgi:hypothetical protein
MAAARSVPQEWVYRMPVQAAFLQVEGSEELLAKAKRAGMLEAAVVNFMVEFGDLEGEDTIEYTVRLEGHYQTKATYNRLVEWGYISLAVFSEVDDHARLAETIGLRAMRNKYPGNYIDASA